MSSREEQLIAALKRPDAYPHAVGAIELIETHISLVFLTGEFAYKIKKPVRYPFVDFTSLESRRHFCHEELRLNRRLAPELYLEIVPIGGSETVPRIGAEPAFEYAVKMVQFPHDAMLETAIARRDFPVEAVTAFAESMAEFHLGADRCGTFSSADNVAANLDQLVSVVDESVRPRIDSVGAWLNATADSLAGLRSRRWSDGAVRDCHGDLHLGNLVWLDRRIVPFDCLEFDEALRCVDTMDEVAFFVMDCLAHQRDDLAFRFLNRYLEVAGDYDGLRLLRYYLVHRALVRAKVCLLTDFGTRRGRAARYIDLAESLCGSAEPVLILTRGLSGSGKTTVSAGLIGRLPAIRVRSDLERKRLHGLAPAERSHSDVAQGIYTAAVSDATYERLIQAADAGLAAGLSVIVDAACLERRRRETFARLAARSGADFIVLCFVADVITLRDRIRRRNLAGRDASEADLAVLDYQLGREEPVSADEAGIHIQVETESVIDADTLASRIRKVVRAASLGNS